MFDAAGVSRLPLFPRRSMIRAGWVHVKDVDALAYRRSLGAARKRGARANGQTRRAIPDRNNVPPSDVGASVPDSERQPDEAHRFHPIAPPHDFRAAVDAGRQSPHPHAVDTHPHGPGGG